MRRPGGLVSVSWGRAVLAVIVLLVGWWSNLAIYSLFVLEGVCLLIRPVLDEL